MNDDAVWPRETYWPILHLPDIRGGLVIRRPKDRVQPASDEQLVLRLKAGDAEAFGELYEYYRPRVYRFASKLLQDADQAEDIVQETFLKARAAIQSLNQSFSLVSWLLTITRNEVYGQLRKRRSNGQANVDDVWDTETPLEEVIGAETVEIVQRVLAQLKPDYREVILLREYERMSYAEIAHITQDTEGAVKARLFKARKALVKKLKPYFGEQS